MPLGRLWAQKLLRGGPSWPGGMGGDWGIGGTAPFAGLGCPGSHSKGPQDFVHYKGNCMHRRPHSRLASRAFLEKHSVTTSQVRTGVARPPQRPLGGRPSPRGPQTPRTPAPDPHCPRCIPSALPASCPRHTGDLRSQSAAAPSLPFLEVHPRKALRASRTLGGPGPARGDAHRLPLKDADHGEEHGRGPCPGEPGTPCPSAHPQLTPPPQSGALPRHPHPLPVRLPPYLTGSSPVSQTDSDEKQKHDFQEEKRLTEVW